MMTMMLKLCIVVGWVALVYSFRTFAPTVRTSTVPQRLAAGPLSMGSGEYIPDGLSKQQWEEIQRKEKEQTKGKNFAAVGITKFQSKSFEAWQKSGMGYLFPTDPSKTPEEERPYMMRQGGSADGADLRKRGLKGSGQGKFVPKTSLDEKYEAMDATGESIMFPFNIVRAYSTPWNSRSPQNIQKV